MYAHMFIECVRATSLEKCQLDTNWSSTTFGGWHLCKKCHFIKPYLLFAGPTNGIPAGWMYYEEIIFRLMPTVSAALCDSSKARHGRRYTRTSLLFCSVWAASVHTFERSSWMEVCFVEFNGLYSTTFLLRSLPQVTENSSVDLISLLYAVIQVAVICKHTSSFSYFY